MIRIADEIGRERRLRAQDRAEQEPYERGDQHGTHGDRDLCEER